MSSIDLAKLAELLSDSQSGEDIISVHRKIDRLITGKNSSWTESAMAIVAIITLLFGITAAGLTGYLNLREPLKAIIKDVERMETSCKDSCKRLSTCEANILTIKNTHEHDMLKREYALEKVNSRLLQVEKYRNKNNIFMGETKGDKP